MFTNFSSQTPVGFNFCAYPDYCTNVRQTDNLHYIKMGATMSSPSKIIILKNPKNFSVLKL